MTLEAKKGQTGEAGKRRVGVWLRSVFDDIIYGWPLCLLVNEIQTFPVFYAPNLPKGEGFETVRAHICGTYVNVIKFSGTFLSIARFCVSARKKAANKQKQRVL